jgi:hypothetical protein
VTRTDAQISADWRSKLSGRRLLEAAAKLRHTRAQRKLQAARKAGQHPREALVEARDEAADTLALRRRQVAAAERTVARHAQLDTVVAFDGCPVPRGLALALGDARAHGWPGTVQSCDRREGVAERFGKSSQAALYRGWLRRLPGFNPANPPGFSSHERRHDGSASLSALGQSYRRGRGALLKWWQTGVDASGSAELVAVLGRLGYSAARTYDSPQEAHHVNFRTDPTARLKSRGLV